jgi:hypothetical protein
MVKPLPVKDVAYVHATDIDHTKHMNVAPTNDAMEECVNWGAQALMNGSPSHPADKTQHMRSVLLSMRWTHRLIRKVLSFDKADEKPMAVDGLSLARVPLEGLFTICLMLEGPVWVDRYLRDGWKRQYTVFLLQRRETENLPRFATYNFGSGPDNLTKLQDLLGVTAAQRATIELNELGVPLPADMKPEGIERFPTPLGVIGKLPPGDKRRMLERAYPEYTWLCSFVHGLPYAMFYKTITDKDALHGHVLSEAALEEAFRRRVREPAYLISLLSIIQAVTELTAMYPADVKLRAAVAKTWKEIPDAILFGKVLWEIRTKKLLGVIG